MFFSTIKSGNRKSLIKGEFEYGLNVLDILSTQKYQKLGKKPIKYKILNAPLSEQNDLSCTCHIITLFKFKTLVKPFRNASIVDL